MNIQDGFPIGLTILISLLSKGSQESSPTHSLKASIFWHSALFMIQLSHLYMTTGKTIALTIRIFAGKVISLLFNTLSRFVIAFLPRNKHLLITWHHSPSAVILEPKKIKPVTVATVSRLGDLLLCSPATLSHKTARAAFLHLNPVIIHLNAFRKVQFLP